MAIYNWQDIPDQRPDGVDPGEMVVVFPLAATEQHGPHLPFSTDVDIAAGLLEAAKAKIPQQHHVALLPVEAVGASMEHSRFAGTAYITTPALISRIYSVAADLAGLGIRKLVLITSHGGNISAMMAAALEIRARLDMLAVTTSWARLGLPDRLVDAKECEIGVHGGLIETSLMLNFRPELVDMANAEDFNSSQSVLDDRYELLKAYGPVGYGWLAEDLNSRGAVGNAAGASADIGEKITEFQAEKFATLLGEIAEADIDELLTSKMPAEGP